MWQGCIYLGKNDAVIFSQEIRTWCIGTQIDKTCIFADTADMAVEEQEVIVGIVTDIDLLQYISRAEQGSGSGSESPVDKSDNPQS